MIAHLVLFKPKPELTRAARQAVVDALTSAAAAIPEIRRFRIGRRVRHGLPGYEQAAREDFEYAAIIEFDDVEGLKAYLAHPAHAAAATHFTESAGAALACDFEIGEISEGSRLADD